MNLISNLSLFVMWFSLVFAVLHPKISLPLWFDSLIWCFIISITAMIVNNNVYTHNITAEVLLCFVGSILVACTVYDKFKRSVRCEL